MRKVAELKGYKSLRALNAYTTLLIGMKYLPAYAKYSYEEFLALLDKMPLEDQRKVLTTGAKLVELDKEEVEALVSFCSDPNGVPYTAENIVNLDPFELVEVIVSVCLSISQMKLDLISDSEKKN